jgi:hypothetical protein
LSWIISQLYISVSRFASHGTLLPSVPLHIHDQETGVGLGGFGIGIPELHKFVVGALEKHPPSAVPHDAGSVVAH